MFSFTMVTVTPSETRGHTCCPCGTDMAPFHISSPGCSRKTGRERLYYACARTARTPPESVLRFLPPAGTWLLAHVFEHVQGGLTLL